MNVVGNKHYKDNIKEIRAHTCPNKKNGPMADQRAHKNIQTTFFHSKPPPRPRQARRWSLCPRRRGWQAAAARGGNRHFQPSGHQAREDRDRPGARVGPRVSGGASPRLRRGGLEVARRRADSGQRTRRGGEGRPSRRELRGLAPGAASGS